MGISPDSFKDDLNSHPHEAAQLGRLFLLRPLANRIFRPMRLIGPKAMARVTEPPEYADSNAHGVPVRNTARNYFDRFFLIARARRTTLILSDVMAA